MTCKVLLKGRENLTRHIMLLILCLLARLLGWSALAKKVYKRTSLKAYRFRGSLGTNPLQIYDASLATTTFFALIFPLPVAT